MRDSRRNSVFFVISFLSFITWRIIFTSSSVFLHDTLLRFLRRTHLGTRCQNLIHPHAKHRPTFTGESHWSGVFAKVGLPDVASRRSLSSTSLSFALRSRGSHLHICKEAKGIFELLFENDYFRVFHPCVPVPNLLQHPPTVSLRFFIWTRNSRDKSCGMLSGVPKCISSERRRRAWYLWIINYD